MTDDKNIPARDDKREESAEEGAYTDVETETGRDVKEDSEEGEYTDVDRGDGTTR